MIAANLQVQTTVTFEVPQNDMPEFSRLSMEQRSRVKLFLQICAQIESETGNGCSVQSACVAHAKSWQGQRGFSAVSIRRNFDAYVEQRDWRLFVDRSRAGSKLYGAGRLPLAAIEYWRALCERNQRKCEPAHRVLITQWRRWYNGDASCAIPGFDVCPKPDPATGIPRGFGYRNLMRHRPTNFELAASRIGRSAAAVFRPKVALTRRDLKVGQYYLFDDLWHDFKVNVVGQRRAQRLLQFHALDLFSGCNFARGMKPVLENEVTQVQERLKEVEMLFLVTHILTTYGYRTDTGTVFVVEHGTAAITDEIEQQLFDLTQGAIRIERSGMEGASAFAGQYAGRSKGNFRFKAALESLGNLVHNETAFLPGQTGSNSRLNAPEELHGRDRLNDRLLLAMRSMPPDRRDLLRLPFVEFNQAMKLVNEIHECINARTEHELEGWVEAGLVRQEFRLSPEQIDWLPMSSMLQLDDVKRSAVAALIDQPDMARVRKLSPAEVFRHGSRDLVKLPDHSAALLLGRNSGHEVTVRSHAIEFQDKSLAPSALRFHADRLPEGERYRACVDPITLNKLFLFDAQGGFVTAVDRHHSVSRADTEALHRACGRAAKVEAELLAPIAARGAAITRQRIADARHNAAVLAGRPITAEERAAIRSENEFVRENQPSDADRAAALSTEVEGQQQFTSDEIAEILSDENQ